MTPYPRLAYRLLGVLILLLTLSTGHPLLAMLYAFLWAFEEAQRRGR